MLTYDDSSKSMDGSEEKIRYYNYKDSSWYKLGRESQGAVYTTSYNDNFGRGVVITCVSPFYDGDGNFAGCVALDIHTEEVFRSIVGDGIVEPDLAYLIDGSGNILAEKDKVSTEHDKENIFTTENHPELNYISEFLYDGREHGVEFWVDEKTGTEYFLAFANIVDVNWDLVIKSPLTEILGPVNSIENEIDDNTSRMAESISLAIKTVISNCLFLFAILLLVIVIVVRKESDKMTRPVKILDRDVRKISRGNLEHRTKVHTDDEIGYLATAFNSMTESMEKYVADLQEATAREERTASELALATSIQANMLPADFEDQKRDNCFDIFASMKPAKEVAGDFYDYFRLDDDHIALVMADVSGKGVPAALFMMITMILIKTNAHSEESPAEILRLVNNQLCDNNKEDMFTTAWMAIIDLRSGHVVTANAGHEFPVLKGSNGTFEIINDKHGLPLGVMPETKFEEYEFDLYEGSVIFTYTDGVVEATDNQNELYGIDRLVKALNTVPDASPVEIVDNVRQSINSFVGDVEQFDDITMMAFKYLKKTST